MHTKKAYSYDHFASVAVTLQAGVEYLFTYHVQLSQGTGNRKIFVGYNTTQALTGATQLANYQVPVDTYTQLPFLPFSTKFTVPTTGTYNMIVWSEGPHYTHMYMDDISLERAVYPQVSITSPVK